MKRVLLIASALCIGIAAFVIDTNPGITQAQTAASVATGGQARPVPEASIVDQDAPYVEACAREGLSDSACVGRLIWYKATGGNDRFHTYTFQQRIGVLVDWYRVLRSDQRDDRFAAWGIINDPACCKPGDPDCPAKSPDETYGFDWCPGRRRAAQVRRQARVCRSRLRAQGRAARRQGSAHQGRDDRSAPVGVRSQVRHVDGRARLAQVSQSALRCAEVATVERRQPRQLGRLPQADDQGDRHPVGRAREQARRRFDRAAVPDRHGLRLVPHRVRSAQSAQGSRASEVGEHQGPRRQPVFAHVGAAGLGNAEDQHRVADVHPCAPGRHRHVGDLARPGQQSGDDEFDHQPRAAAAVHGEVVTKWRKADTLRRREGRRQVLVRAGSRQQVLAAQHAQRRQDAGPRRRPSHPERRGGLDRRPRSDPAGLFQHRFLRGGVLGQSPDRLSPGRSRPARLRPDVVSHRPVPARLPALPRDRGSARQHSRFLPLRGGRRDRSATSPAIASARPGTARPATTRARTSSPISTANSARTPCGGAGCCSPKTARGAIRASRTRRPTRSRRGTSTPSPKTIRARCARISSATTRPRRRPRWARSAAARCTRITWRGICMPSTAPRRCAAGRWSRTFRSARRSKDNGRGYYRNISLLNVWATAPFMHNNAIGPEVCGKPKNAENDFFRSRYVDASGKLVDPQPQCVVYDPSVSDRFELYRKSMYDLLHPKERGVKADAHRLRRDRRHRPSHPGTARRRRPSSAPVSWCFRRAAPPAFSTASSTSSSSTTSSSPSAIPPGSRRPARRRSFPSCRRIADDIAKNPARFVDVLKEQIGVHPEELRDVHADGRERRSSLRRGPARVGQEGADGLLATL